MKNSINAIYEKYSHKCYLCGNLCGVNREKHFGLCKSKNILKIASSVLHFSEEPPISGTNGSGTIFFSNCSLNCVYCQNFPISQNSVGKEITIEKLGKRMLLLQKKNAHNINLVTPTHYIYHIVKAIDIARSKGLIIPIVYNTSSYENPEIVDYLNDFMDIYLADIRYANNEDAYKYSGIKNYTDIVFKNILKFHKLKGNLKIRNNIAYKGVLIRILVLPGKIKETKEIINFIEKNIGNDIYISIMNQYFPYYKSDEYPEINRRIYSEEYEEVLDYIIKKGFENVFTQEFV